MTGDMKSAFKTAIEKSDNQDIKKVIPDIVDSKETIILMKDKNMPDRLIDENSSSNSEENYYTKDYDLIDSDTEEESSEIYEDENEVEKDYTFDDDEDFDSALIETDSGLRVNVSTFMKEYKGKKVEIIYNDPSTGEQKTAWLDPAEFIEASINFDEKIENSDKISDSEIQEAKNQTAILIDQLAEKMVTTHGLVKITDADILYSMTERQAVNDVLESLFKELDAPILTVRLAPAPFKTMFGARILSLLSITNNARQIIANYQRMRNRLNAAENEVNRIKGEEERLINDATRTRNEAHKLLKEAEIARNENAKAIQSFNVPSVERPFVLRGSYITVKKSPKGKKDIEKKRIVYVGLKKNFKIDKKTGLPFSKYFFATTKMEEAARFSKADEAMVCMDRLRSRFLANKLNEDAGFNERKIKAIRVTRIIMESMN